MTVLVLSPHPDDEALGCGGTIARYSKDGEKVIVAVFASGTGSHPLHKEHFIARTRKAEAESAHKILGVSKSVFFELDEFDFKNELLEKEVIPKLGELIKKEKVTKVFMPAIDDTHNHHRIVSHAMLQTYSQYELECHIYTYSIWNPLSILKRTQPRLVVDVTETQQLKLEAIREYSSQWLSVYQLLPIIAIKTFFSGLRYGCRWAEVFIQIR